MSSSLLSTIYSHTSVPSIPPVSSLPLQSVEEIRNEPFLKDAELYYHHLKSDKSIALFGDNVVVIKEICFNKQKLENGKYILIERKPARLSTNGNYQWIYWCSCDTNRSRQVASLDSRLKNTFDEFIKHYPDCIHISVGRIILSHYDRDNDIDPYEAYGKYTEQDGDHNYSIEDVVYEVQKNLICCRPYDFNRFGLVSFLPKIFCTTCPSNKCSHVHVVKRLQKEGIESPYYEIMNSPEDIYIGKSQKQKQTLLSFKKIPFSRSDNLANKLKNINLFGDIVMCDQTSCRECGSNLHYGDPVEENWLAYDNAGVVTNTKVQYVKVYYRPCTSCSTLSMFEGQSLGLLNLGTYLVGYDVLRSYLHSFLHGRRPLYTFYQTFCDVHVDDGNKNIHEDFSYNRLRMAWHSFLKLIDIDLTLGFNCPDCGDLPGTIICDGTSISFQRRMHHWREHEESTHILKLTADKFADRIFLEPVLIRNNLKRYVCGGNFERGVKQKPLDDKEKEKLFEGVKNSSESLYCLLMEIEENSDLLPVYKDLILCLASPSPVCRTLRPTDKVRRVLNGLGNHEKMAVWEDVPLWQLLHEQIPILFSIYESRMVSSNLLPLLEEMWLVSSQPFIFSKMNENHAPSVNIEEEEEMSFFPSLKKYRARGHFNIDRKKVPKSSCCKRYPGHPSLLPGIFTIFCPHEICYGFQIMESNESPNVPFTILRTRFRKAPKVVVYDNTCKLHDYCISRDPVFFQETEFYIDRLHWVNHTSCSLAYNISLYPQYQHLNSQCNEQANAGLKRIKDQLSYMTANNFMVHCSLYLWNKNRLIKDRII